MSSPNLAVGYLAEAQAMPEVTINNAINKLEGLTQLAIQYAGDDPPGSPASGQRFLVQSGTGAWSGHNGEIALYYAGWYFATPKAGWICWDKDVLQFMTYNGVTWKAFAGNVGDLTDSSGATPDDRAVHSVGATNSGDVSGVINKNFSLLCSAINDILAAMKDSGIMHPD